MYFQSHQNDISKSNNQSKLMKIPIKIQTSKKLDDKPPDAHEK